MFQFIHYAVGRYKDRVERGHLTILAFIFFFPTLVAGPIKRFQCFAPNLRQPGTDWVTDWHRDGTRILVGLAKKFSVADLLTSLTDHLNRRHRRRQPLHPPRLVARLRLEDL